MTLVSKYNFNHKTLTLFSQSCSLIWDLKVWFSYFLHSGLLSTRHHIHTSRRPSSHHCSDRFYTHSLQRKKLTVRKKGADSCFIRFTVYCLTYRLTLVTVDSILPALAGFTGCPIETFVALTDSGAIRPVQTGSVTEAGLTLRSWTRLTVLSEKPSTTLRQLETENISSFLGCLRTFRLHPCNVLMWHTMFAWRQVARQPMVNSRSSSNTRMNIHFFLLTDFCTQQ